MNENLNKAIEILKRNNQEHVIQFLENGKNTELLDQVLKMDFEELKELYNITRKEISVEIDEIEPVTVLNPKKLSEEQIDKIKSAGIDIIKQNKFAVSTMAGRTGNKASDTAEQKEHIK